MWQLKYTACGTNAYTAASITSTTDAPQPGSCAWHPEVPLCVHPLLHRRLVPVYSYWFQAHFQQNYLEIKPYLSNYRVTVMDLEMYTYTEWEKNYFRAALLRT